MAYNLDFQQNKIFYTLKFSQRARRLRLAIYSSGEFVVTAPRFMGRSAIKKFIAQKSHWITGKLAHFKKLARQAPLFSLPRRNYAECRAEALKMASSRLDFFNIGGRFGFNHVSVKNQKTRWGSCSKKGNLNFNYKIILLPPPLADYIIVHELCHLKEFNHSRKFWALVAELMPDYAARRRELRDKIFLKF